MFFTKSIDYPIDRGSREFPGVPRREEWVGLRFYVKFSLSEREEGLYKFRIIADDSARLIIGKKLVVNASGLGKTQEKSGEVTLKAGSHEMFLDYFQARGRTGFSYLSLLRDPKRRSSLFNRIVLTIIWKRGCPVHPFTTRDGRVASSQ